MAVASMADQTSSSMVRFPQSPLKLLPYGVRDQVVPMRIRILGVVYLVMLRPAQYDLSRASVRVCSSCVRPIGVSCHSRRMISGTTQ